MLGGFLNTQEAQLGRHMPDGRSRFASEWVEHLGTVTDGNDDDYGLVEATDFPFSKYR